MEDFSAMFWHSYQFNSDLSTWVVASATTIEFIFNSAWNFNSDLSKWSVSKVTSMRYAFRTALRFEGTHLFCNSSEWDTIPLDLTDFTDTATPGVFHETMYNGETSFSIQQQMEIEFYAETRIIWCGRPDELRNINIQSAVDDWIGNGTKKTLLLEHLPKIEEWDTSRITRMAKLFYAKPTFTADISKWNTAAVTTMLQSTSTPPLFSVVPCLFHLDSGHSHPHCFFHFLFSLHYFWVGSTTTRHRLLLQRS